MEVVAGQVIGEMIDISLMSGDNQWQVFISRPLIKWDGRHGMRLRGGDVAADQRRKVLTESGSLLHNAPTASTTGYAL